MKKIRKLYTSESMPSMNMLWENYMARLFQASVQEKVSLEKEDFEALEFVFWSIKKDCFKNTLSFCGGGLLMQSFFRSDIPFLVIDLVGGFCLLDDDGNVFVVLHISLWCFSSYTAFRRLPLLVILFNCYEITIKCGCVGYTIILQDLHYYPLGGNPLVSIKTQWKNYTLKP